MKERNRALISINYDHRLCLDKSIPFISITLINWISNSSDVESFNGQKIIETEYCQLLLGFIFKSIFWNKLNWFYKNMYTLGCDRTLSLKIRKETSRWPHFFFTFSFGSKWGGIPKISFHPKRKERYRKVSANNGQLCLQLPPRVAHASCLDQLLLLV